jgi:hypothetical protein
VKAVHIELPNKTRELVYGKLFIVIQEASFTHIIMLEVLTKNGSAELPCARHNEAGGVSA